jgi:hypothetical protein
VPRYRRELANSLNGLGAVFFQQKRAEEAELTWKEAVQEIKVLVDRLPDVAAYHVLFAQTTHNLSYLRRDNPQWAELEELLREAIQAQKRAVELSPHNTLYSQTLRSYERALCRVLTDRGKHVEAAELAEQLAASANGESQTMYAAAKILAQCAMSIEQDKTLDEARITELTKRYRSKSQELVAICREQGLAIQVSDFPGVNVEPGGSQH